VYPWTNGPTEYNHKAAQKVCDHALTTLKAQMVGYTVYGPHYAVESWERRRNGTWQKKKEKKAHG